MSLKINGGKEKRGQDRAERETEGRERSLPSLQGRSAHWTGLLGTVYSPAWNSSHRKPVSALVWACLLRPRAYVWSSFNNSTLTKNCFWVAQFITSFHFHPFYSAIGPSVHQAKETTGEPNKQLQNRYEPICK